jgi:hypothetical protein
MLPRLHNNTNNNTTNLNHTIPTLIITLPHDISHDNTTTTITLPNRNRWTIIPGALFGIPTTHSYADDTTFIIIPVLLYVDDTISLKLPTDISHDNTTTTITLPNRNRWTIILGALFGIPTTHSYADDTTFIIIPVLLYVDDTISLKLPTDISHDNTTTTITLPNRNRRTIILGALFGIPTTHSYADDTTFTTIPVLLYVDDTISLKIPTYTPNDA